MPLSLYGNFAVNYPINLKATSFGGLSKDDLSKLALVETSMCCVCIVKFKMLLEKNGVNRLDLF